MNSNNDLTLVIMAAGLGSRYGGIKQLDQVGPSGECIMEYSIYDAIKAGFNKIVFIIKKAFETEFNEKITRKWDHQIEIKHVFQDVKDVPAGFNVPPTRQKPWGTGHAVLSARHAINSPFTVINADDFYGYKSFKLISDELTGRHVKSNEHCLVAYKLCNTLSDFGSVSRGICTIENNYLSSINELTDIKKDGNLVVNQTISGVEELDTETLVSMNFWGFTPSIFEVMSREFEFFLKQGNDNIKAEFFIAYPLDKGIKEKHFSIKVLETDEKWMGVTYQEDKSRLQSGIKFKIEKGDYPSNLYAKP